MILSMDKKGTVTTEKNLNKGILSQKETKEAGLKEVKEEKVVKKK